MSVPFCGPVADKAVEVLTDGRPGHDLQLLGDALALAFPDLHWSMTDEHLFYARQLIDSAAGLAPRVRDGSLSLEEALRSLRKEYAPFSEGALRRALTFVTTASDA